MNIPNKLPIDPSWTLFLDRDGVLNKKIDESYISKLADFELFDFVPEVLAKLRAVFGRIVVVTNQQGIGKGLMSEMDLQILHDFMCEKIQARGGRIDKIYFAPQLDNKQHNYYRKPGVGMALHAKTDFPEIDFARSVMVGDSFTDILFGKKMGMKTVWIQGNPNASEKADFLLSSLSEFPALCGII
jgi:histidinol-phosphate phosphatase family protein